MAMIGKFFSKLRQRNVFRAGIAYVVSGWLFVQIADVLLPIFDAPDSIMRALIIALGVGFPLALTFSWFFEITPTGIKRSEDVAPDDAAGQVFDRRMNFVIIAILIAALSLSLYGNFRSPAAPREMVSILIADFENQSGNDLFSGVVEDFLLVGLEVAPFVNAFSRKDAATIAADLPGAGAGPIPLNAETAALIALREGVNIVIAGTVSRTDDRLTVSVTGISAGDQQELFSLREDVAADADILNAIAALSKKVRIKLGNTEKPLGAGESESFAVVNLQAAAEYLKAQDLQLDRRLEDAVTHYENALEFDPNFARAYAGLALTEQYLGNSEAATSNWKEALARLDRLTERGRLRTLGNYFMINQGDYEKALETYESLVEKYPADNVAHNNLAVAAFYAMDFDRALEGGREVASRFPKHSGYRGNLTLYAMYASRFDEASGVAEALIDDDPSSAYAFLVMALTSAVNGDLTAAEDTYKRMLGLGQFGRSIANEGLADLAAYRGDFTGAIDTLDRSIEAERALNSAHTVALKQIMKVQALLNIGATKDAREVLYDALASAGGDSAILVPAAMALIQLGANDEADAVAAQLSESLSLPKRAYALAIRAQIAASSEQLDSAIEQADAALDTVDLWLIRYLRAQLHNRAGRYAAALADLEVCQQRIGEGIAVFLNDRPSYRLMRDFEAALAATQKAAQRGP